ncbi:hypothetical protein [Actinomadura hibisca]|uniref:hypothetical protein n=1 Tax=Actinomadura hibisca TaxID=68565 RepID=UPI00082978FA|nr:hypothetical protein [Actinomadura hibisca]
MTERSPGAPDPAEPSHSGGRPVRSPAGRTNVSRADPAGIGRTDAIIEALADRRAAAFEPDPAVRLLRALIADVDEPVLRRVPTGEAAEPAPETSGAAQPAGTEAPAPRRRGPRTIVALGVAGVVLASTGVAAAGSGVTEPAAPAPQAAEAGRGEAADRARAERASRARTRSNPEVQPSGGPAAPAQRPAERRAVESKPASEPDRPQDQLDELRDELERLLAPRPRARQPKLPTTWPGRRGDRDAGEETRRQLDDIRRRAEKRIDRHR